MTQKTPASAHLVRLMRLPNVLAARGDFSKTQHYDDIGRGLYTPPVKIGLRASAWPENEVAELNAARIAGKSEAEIRCLVAKLEAERKALA